MRRAPSRPNGRKTNADTETLTITWRRRKNKSEEMPVWKKMAIGVMTSVLSAILIWIGKTAIEMLIAALSKSDSFLLAANYVTNAIL